MSYSSQIGTIGVGIILLTKYRTYASGPPPGPDPITMYSYSVFCASALVMRNAKKKSYKHHRNLEKERYIAKFTNSEATRFPLCLCYDIFMRQSFNRRLPGDNRLFYIRKYNPLTAKHWLRLCLV
jgi:hypothetical protein